MLHRLRTGTFRRQIVGGRTYAVSRCLRTSAVNMAPLGVDTTLRMKSGYDIPQLGFGEHS
jgi:hypothetical protein